MSYKVFFEFNEKANTEVEMLNSLFSYVLTGIKITINLG